jgi:acylphosphatase
VEALFEGERETLNSMLAWCHQGPRYSYVDQVKSEWQPYRGNLQSFRIVY